MWADIDAKSDFLNFSEVAELVIDVVGSPSMRPVSVGVFGTWGTGKSTILNLIEDGLSEGENEGRYIVVRFDAWLYQGFDDARAALMEVIAAELLKVTEEDKSLFDKAKSLFKRVNKMRALGLAVDAAALAHGVPTLGVFTKGFSALGELMSGGGDDKAVGELKEAGKKAREEAKELVEAEEKKTPPEEIAAFRDEFEEVLRGLGKTLVVFVDNLDRCLPQQTIHTLEALRLYLFMDHTAFVVAADEDMVRHSVSKFFLDLDDRHITDYLDKLIQVPVRVPALGVQEIRAYLFMLFASADPDVGEGRLDALRLQLEDSLRKAWEEEPISTERALTVLGTVSADLTRAFGIADRMAAMLVHAEQVRGNPRIIKRMLNVVRMRSKVAKRRSMPIDEALIAKFALFERCADSAALSHLHKEINEAQEGKPEILVKLSQLLGDEKAFEDACPKEWKSRHAFVREWLALDPPLTDANLRPLVYLNRETMPLRGIKGGLSEAATEGLRVLRRAASTNSTIVVEAAQGIPSPERLSVMKALIGQMRSHADWVVAPAGVHGAIALARVAPEPAADLAAFLRNANPEKLPPWLNVLVKEDRWFTNGGTP